MDVWEKSMREDHHNNKNRRENGPSFSSTLLDAIYRSIDESNGKEHDHDREELFFYKEKTMRKKHSGNIEEEGEDEMESMRRACMIERWMEKKTSCEKVVVRRKSMADYERKLLQSHSRNDLLMNSSSSSSDSSCGGGFSSSESDSFYVATKETSASNSSSCYSMPRPKPIRTSISTGMPERYEKVFHQTRSENSFLHERNNVTMTQKPKKNHENGFVRTKSKALKIYSDLKKVKQPISPGGRLASFLNSLFTAGNAKKAKRSSNNVYDSSRNESISACSSASSFSRSCLSNTPSSRGKVSNNGTKRSVRFFPVSVIVDEDCRPCGHKNLYENDHVMSENRRVAEAARELLKSYQKKELDHHDRMMVSDSCDVNGRIDVEDEDDDDDDAASYASSDLFELDTIGIERYREELPVYETTHLGTNRAIASGLIL